MESKAARTENGPVGGSERTGAELASGSDREGRALRHHRISLSPSEWELEGDAVQAASDIEDTSCRKRLIASLSWVCALGLEHRESPEPSLYGSQTKGQWKSS